MTIRDASYLILLLVLNGDSEISLDFEIRIDCFLFLFFAVSMLFTAKKPGYIRSIVKVSEFIFMLFILNFLRILKDFPTISSGYVCTLLLQLFAYTLLLQLFAIAYYI